MSDARIDLVVHATHEAGCKVGGIGAVLDGILSDPAYNTHVGRTVLVGPLEVQDTAGMQKLIAPGNRLEMIYSSLHGIDLTTGDLGIALRAVETRYHVRLLYGRRAFGPYSHEVLLVDPSTAELNATGRFKYDLYEHYGIRSERYQDPEYDFHVKAATPAYEALESLVGQTLADPAPRALLLAHDVIGLPIVLRAQTWRPNRWKSVFYAHEVATVRDLVEWNEGHDTRFYNVLRLCQAQGVGLGQAFGDQSGFWRHALLMAGLGCDRIFAVGDLVVDELSFISGNAVGSRVDLAYNGVASHAVTLEERQRSKRLLQEYCQNLLGYRPDFVFSHVTRFVISKGIWRDVRVLEHLDRLLADRGETAVLFLLTTAEPSGRTAEDVYRWEEEYGWPVVHHTSNGDLLRSEIPLYQAISPYWTAPGFGGDRSRAIKVVLINQFGWSRDRCGRRMPADMRFPDLRLGTDLEFGMSIYEPFGISIVEPLYTGALCVPSSICGCDGFIRQAVAQTGLESFPNVVTADYVYLPPEVAVSTVPAALNISKALRDQIEHSNSRPVAEQIARTLPRSVAEGRVLLEAGQRVGQSMSWARVVSDYILPGLRRAW